MRGHTDQNYSLCLKSSYESYLTIFCFKFISLWGKNVELRQNNTTLFALEYFMEIISGLVIL